MKDENKIVELLAGNNFKLDKFSIDVFYTEVVRRNKKNGIVKPSRAKCQIEISDFPWKGNNIQVPQKPISKLLIFEKILIK